MTLGEGHPSPIPPLLAHVWDWEAERMREAKERAKMVERMEKKMQSEDQMCFLCGVTCVKASFKFKGKWN